VLYTVILRVIDYEYCILLLTLHVINTMLITMLSCLLAMNARVDKVKENDS